MEILQGTILDHFPEGDQRRIEFIDTDAPSELDPEDSPDPVPTADGGR